MTVEMLSKLIAIQGSPIEIPDAMAWRRFESESIRVPSDYKEFLSIYGSGLLADFFWIWNPFSEFDQLNWIKQKDGTIHAYRLAITDSPDLYGDWKLYPDDGGLLPCGNTISGDTVFWATT